MLLDVRICPVHNLEALSFSLLKCLFLFLFLCFSCSHFTFMDEANGCQQKVTKLNACLSNVLKSLDAGALRSVLALTLKVGNYLNHGTKNGSARGFSLDSLALLRTIKSVDGATTILK